MSHASELQREVQSVIALYNANVKMFNDRNLNIKNIFFNAFDELTRCPVALVVFKDMCILKVQFRNISTAGAKQTDASIDASSQNIFTKANRMIQSYLALRKTLCIDIRKENLDICWCEAVDADIPKFPIRLQPTKRNIMR